MQTRVVATTLVSSGVVVGLLASLLLAQVGQGLVDTKIRASLSEAQSGAQQVRTLVEDLTTADPAVYEVRLAELTQKLSDRGAAAGLYSVVLEGPATANTLASPNTGPDDIPPGLRARLAASAGPLYLFARVPDQQGREVDGLVVGSVITVPLLGPFRLFYLFPVSAEEATYSLVQRTAAAAGLLLVLLLALISLLVTRQVVAPVQLAARTAERLAEGLLDVRMPVHGEDELARLGRSFNSMAEALQSHIRQLEELSSLQRRFVSDVSHELRTPLTTVRMAADVLHECRDTFPAAAARSAELLQAELNRFEGLLVDLLEISRYDAGAASLDSEATDLVPLVRQAVSAAEPLAAARGTRFDLSRLPDHPVLVEADHIRIERVLRNLVVNAVEHGEGRPIEVSVAGDETSAAVVVRDFGVGLRAGEADLVFTRFWRGDPSRARSSGGTGLGLAIAMEDVRLHGGWLDAWGEPGLGAAFRMTLPRRSGAALGGSPLPLRPEAVR